MNLIAFIGHTLVLLGNKVIELQGYRYC
jgi:hypothetical protein